MPTSKKRLNITLPKHLALFLARIAVRDNLPQATKAAQLLERALAIEEDEYFSHVADERVKKNTGFVSHEEFWNSLR